MGWRELFPNPDLLNSYIKSKLHTFSSKDHIQNIWVKILEVKPNSLVEIDTIIKQEKADLINEYFRKRREEVGLYLTMDDGKVVERYLEKNPRRKSKWHISSSCANWRRDYRESQRYKEYRASEKYKKLERDRKRNRYNSDPKFRKRILENGKRYAKNHPDRIQKKTKNYNEYKRNKEEKECQILCGALFIVPSVASQ